MEKEELDIKAWYTPFPENLKKYSNLNSMAIIFCEQIVKEILPEVNILSFYLNWDSLSDETLDELAVNWNVEHYNSEFSKEKKISLIKNSYELKKNKGTNGVLESALKIIVQDLDVQEWYKYGGNPYMFKLVVSGKLPSEEEITKIYKTVNDYKNTRSTLEGFYVTKEDYGSTKYIGVNHNTGRIINKFIG